MSRIDEALKRTAGGGAAAPRKAATQAAVEASLEHYPREIGVPDQPVVELMAPVERVEQSDLPLLPVQEVVLAPAGQSGGPIVPMDGHLDTRLVVSKGAGPVSIEQYRRLAAAVHGLQMDRGLKTLMVTSAVPNEGKTLTVTNLALTLSESYKRRVLLIDADLRRPSIHNVFRIPNATGLVEVLRSERADVPILRLSAHLSVLPAGRPDANPMAGLTSDRMRGLLEQFHREFDWVLLDAAPVGFMPDAQLLASVTGAVLFVIGAGSTPCALVQRAIGELGPDCVVGTVLNRVEGHNIPATAYYDQYYAVATQAAQ
jgi:capsular exopolysaccharide synthesis family protein